MDFLIQWLWYLLAFVAGTALAWLVGTRLRKGTRDQAVDGEAPKSTDVGAWP